MGRVLSALCHWIPDHFLRGEGGGCLEICAGQFRSNSISGLDSTCQLSHSMKTLGLTCFVQSRSYIIAIGFPMHVEEIQARGVTVVVAHVGC